MVSPASNGPGLRGLGVRAVAFAAVLQLVAGLTTALVLDGPAAPSAAVAARARALPPAADLALLARRARTQGVQQLLAQRSAALLRRDRAGFLASVDPAAPALRQRQADVFDALAQVPLGSWDYVLEPTSQRPADPLLDARYGRGQWWAPDVSMRYALQGFDDRPTVVAHHLTFVRRESRWLLAADDDFAAVGRPTPDALWDRGPVVAARAPGTLALGHPESASLVADVAALASAAIPRVSAVWGPQWQQEVVVVVPRDTAEMAALLGSDGDLSRIAAVATAELVAGVEDPAGDRVLVNPEPFSTLSRLGRQVVIVHEVTHVATRRATGPAMPAWLAEGLADTIAYRQVDVPLAVSARELRAAVRAGRVPTRLPRDEDFAGSNPELAQAYEQAWLAVRLLAERHGDAGLLRFYRAVGAARDVDAEQAVEASLERELATTRAAFVADWQAAMRRQLR